MVTYLFINAGKKWFTLGVWFSKNFFRTSLIILGNWAELQEQFNQILFPQYK